MVVKTLMFAMVKLISRCFIAEIYAMAALSEGRVENHHLLYSKQGQNSYIFLLYPTLHRYLSRYTAANINPSPYIIMKGLQDSN